MRKVGSDPVGAVLAAALLVTPFAGWGVLHVWTRTKVLVAGYELDRLHAEHDRLQAECDRLKLEVETLRSPGRLERYARERLGMAPPAPGTVVAGTVGGKAALGGTVDGADRRPGPAEPASSRAGRSGGERRAALRPR
ncbi:MAG TPA: cell division protein FtsL [Anaeromyxobacteraceae bacterium]|nr:cell division protein FtsL [Anaeromyxobacteraceae bacterium]